MDGPEAIAFVALAGVAIGVLILIGEVFKRYMKFKERKLALSAEGSAEKAAQYVAQVERLEERMRVLERIATDKGTGLAREIEDLRDRSPLRAAKTEEELN